MLGSSFVLSFSCPVAVLLIPGLVARSVHFEKWICFQPPNVDEAAAVTKESDCREANPASDKISTTPKSPGERVLKLKRLVSFPLVNRNISYYLSFYSVTYS